jgi:hypothetical protein
LEAILQAGRHQLNDVGSGAIAAGHLPLSQTPSVHWPRKPTCFRDKIPQDSEMTRCAKAAAPFTTLDGVCSELRHWPNPLFVRIRRQGWRQAAGNGFQLICQEWGSAMARLRERLMSDLEGGALAAHSA